MNTANYNRKIEVWKLTEGKSLTNAAIKVKTYFFSIFANRFIRGGTTVYNKETGRSETNVEWTVRWDTGRYIDYNCIIKYDNEFYNILHIEEIGRHQDIKITTIKFQNISY